MISKVVKKTKEHYNVSMERHKQSEVQQREVLGLEILERTIEMYNNRKYYEIETIAALFDALDEEKQLKISCDYQPRVKALMEYNMVFQFLLQLLNQYEEDIRLLSKYLKDTSACIITESKASSDKVLFFGKVIPKLYQIKDEEVPLSVSKLIASSTAGFPVGNMDKAQHNKLEDDEDTNYLISFLASSQQKPAKKGVNFGLADPDQ